jgi:transposase
MLHNEARELLVGGYEATHDAKGIAKAYLMSKWTVYRIAEQKRKTGSVTLRTSQRGRKPVLTAADQENIRQCMDEKADITIEEIREKLSLSASYRTVERVINAMGYTLKKKSLYASERDRIRCAGEEQRMEKDDTT